MHSIPHIILIYADIKADYWLGMNILFKKDDQMTNMLGDIHEKLRELAVGVSKKKARHKGQNSRRRHKSMTVICK